MGEVARGLALTKLKPFCDGLLQMQPSLEQSIVGHSAQPALGREGFRVQGLAWDQGRIQHLGLGCRMVLGLVFIIEVGYPLGRSVRAALRRGST